MGFLIEMNRGPGDYPIAFGITAAQFNPFFVPMNVGTVTRNVTDEMDEKPTLWPYKKIEPVPVLKVPQYSLR